MLQINFLKNFQLNTKEEHSVIKVWDIIRKKWYVLSPEEYVRQSIIHYFINVMQYPKGLISVEKQLKYGSLLKRYDIVVFDRQQMPWLLVECKAPKVPIEDSTLHQLLQYNSQIPCPFWFLSNGHQSYCAKVGENIEWIAELPKYEL